MSNENWIESLALGQTGEALSKLQKKHEVNEKSLDDLSELAKIMANLREKHYFHAGQLLNNLQTDIVDKDELAKEIELLKQANKAINKHKPKEAIKLLEGVGSSLLKAEKLTLEGTANVYSVENSQAMQNFKTALEYDPRHFRALTNIGNLNLEAGNIEQAISNYENALKINDSFSSALHNLGVAYRKQGKLNKSVKYLKKAQRAKNKELKAEARESMKAGENKKVMRYLRYFAIGLTLLAVITILIRQLR